jgi:hypothetical protein
MSCSSYFHQKAFADESSNTYLPSVSGSMNTSTATPPPNLPTPTPIPNHNWAFEETFDLDPVAPSQSLLPKTFDYVVTHRTHPKEHFKVFNTYMADHGGDCAGPDPSISPLPQHQVRTSPLSNGHSPDDSFFICKNHMMSSMGDVEGYSVTAFWPRQEFDFSEGGILEFDVNINGDHTRSWWEVLITPRSELKVGAAISWLPIDETYPKDRIVLQFDDTSTRKMQVGARKLDPEGIIVAAADWKTWEDEFPSDPANSDRRIRRTMRIKFDSNQITWSIEKEDGSFSDFNVDVPGGLPFTRGLVLFKTHAYTPTKAGNFDTYTFHWDNIRFSGPVVGLYEAFDANDVIYLQANGDREIGEQDTVTIDLPHIGSNPVLFGQVHNPMQGQVLLSINGGPQLTVNPYDYNEGTCSSAGWKSFRLELDDNWLIEGENIFTWTIGPRPNCAETWQWNGFSIKNLQVQFDLPN